MVSIPYQQEINDIPSVIARQASARQFAEDVVDAFDEMLQQAVQYNESLVLGIALHPYIVGQPHRLRNLRFDARACDTCISGTLFASLDWCL